MVVREGPIAVVVVRGHLGACSSAVADGEQQTPPRPGRHPCGEMPLPADQHGYLLGYPSLGAPTTG
ncbi:hypothetical protein AB0J84_31510, partial [Micromonospora arborensis]|uniref:hypothetical protein n=1 Tax=Micromonospora arborensis TaxID=2116518 RepID=UPI00342869C8